MSRYQRMVDWLRNAFIVESGVVPPTPNPPAKTGGAKDYFVEEDKSGSGKVVRVIDLRGDQPTVIWTHAGHIDGPVTANQIMRLIEAWERGRNGR